MVPCSKCIGCALEKSRQWAVRCVHESKMHDASSFITLTYDPKYLPSYGSLIKEHFTLFMKRLRRRIEPIKIKFFMCGEYGEENKRPHYHALIFGYAFPDRILLQDKGAESLYTSPLLQEEWGYGFVTTGNVTLDSAAYVARYCLKKTKDPNENLDMDADNFSGQIPEYTNMSRGGRFGKGLSNKWYEQYESDVFPHDNVIIKGKIGKPPRYYDKLLEVSNPQLYEQIKLDRKAKALENMSDNTSARLAVKEQVKISQIKQKQRGL